jgi:hypothetical protein
MHGEDVAFVGLQRTSKRITVSVCDAGVGFLKSLRRTYPDLPFIAQMNHADALLFGCLAQKREHGLRLAINEVLKYDNEKSIFNTSNEGWVVISSFDTEIRWQKMNWGRAIKRFDQFDVNKSKISAEDFLGSPKKRFVDGKDFEDGYWRRSEEFLIGTRITFEIPVEHE